LPAPARFIGADVLADLLDPQPHLLVPAPLADERARWIAEHLGGARAAVGPAMPFDRATSSLRWARQALTTVADGVIKDTGVIFCAAHLATLWLLAEEELLGQVGMRKLAPLREFPDRQRRRLANTLSAWLRTNGNIKEIAGPARRAPANRPLPDAPTAGRHRRRTARPGHALRNGSLSWSNTQLPGLTWRSTVIHDHRL
jgi:hypothetical protein